MRGEPHLADTHTTDLKIKADISDVQNKIKIVNQLVDNLQKNLDKVSAKSANNNQTVSGKDTTNLANQTSQIQALSASINQLNQKISGSYGESSGGKEITKAITDLSKQVNATFKKSGFNANTNGINTSDKYKQVMTNKVNPTKSFIYNPYSDDPALQQLQAQKAQNKIDLKNLGSDVNNTRGSARRTQGRMETTLGTGVISYERKREYEQSFKQGMQRVDINSRQVNSQNELHQSNLDRYKSEYNTIRNKQLEGTSSKSENAKANILKQQIKEEQNTISKLKEFSAALDTAKSTIASSSTTLDTSTSAGGGVSVAPDKDSFMGRLKARSTSLAIAGTSAVASQLSQQNQTGLDNRLSMEESIDPILYSTKAGKNGDNKLINGLAQKGINNGTGYSSKDMATFASAYTSSTGRDDYGKGADAWSKFSRYSGAGKESTLSLETALGNVGAGKNASSVTKTIQSNIVASGMQERAQSQVDALTSYANNVQNSGLSMTGQDVKNASAMQAIMAKEGGSKFQGEAGGKVMQQVTGALTNNNDPVIRSLYADKYGSARYAGINGSVRLQLDQEKGKSDITKLPLEQMRRRFANNPLSEARILKGANQDMSMTDAYEFAKMNNKGDLDPKHIKAYLKKHKNEGNNAKLYKKYTESGNNKYKATKERDANVTSEATDKGRGIIANTFANHPIASVMASSAGGAIVSGLLGKIGGIGIGALSSTLGKRYAGTAAGSLLTKVGTFFGAKGAGEAAETTAKSTGIFSKGKSLLSSGLSKLEGTKVGAKYGPKLARITRGSTNGLLAKATRVTRKGSNLLREGVQATKNTISDARIKARGGMLYDTGKGGSLLSKAEDVAKYGKSLITKGAGKSGTVLSKVGELAKGSKFLRTGSKLLGKAAVPIAVASTAIDAVSGIMHSKKGSKDRYKKVAGAVGSGAGSWGGMSAGAAAGTAIMPGIGTLIGGGIGALAGGKIGQSVFSSIGGLFHDLTHKKKAKPATKAEKAKLQKIFGAPNPKKALKKVNSILFGSNKSTKEKSSEKQKKDKKTKSIISEEKSLLKGFNDMLDKAMRVIKEAKSINADGSSDSGDSDTVDDGGDTGAPAGKGAARWKDKIKQAAKAMGEKVTDEEVNKIINVIQNESSGNEKQPQTIKDHNSEIGQPAQGLLQYVPDTFKRYAVSGHTNIYSGYDQLLAMFNDSTWRRDLTMGGWAPSGARIKNAKGGIYNSATPRGLYDIIGEDGMEAAVPLSSKHYRDGQRMLDKISPALGRVSLDPSVLSGLTAGSTSASFNPSVNINVSVPAGANGNDIASSVNQGVSDALINTMKTMNNYFSQATIQ